MDRPVAAFRTQQDTANQPSFESQTLDDSDQYTAPARIEKRALASLHRQLPRDVFKSKSSPELHVGKLPPSEPSLSSSSPRSAKRRAAGTGSYAPPECPDKDELEKQLAHKMWQLEHENRLLRQLLMASRCSCNDPEESVQDPTQDPEAYDHRLADKHALTPTGEPEGGAPKFHANLALPQHSCESTNNPAGARPSPEIDSATEQPPNAGGYERGLWEATAHPLRPRGYAFMPGLPSPTSPFLHAQPPAEPFGMDGTDPALHHPATTPTPSLARANQFINGPSTAPPLDHPAAPPMPGLARADQYISGPSNVERMPHFNTARPRARPCESGEVESVYRPTVHMLQGKGAPGLQQAACQLPPPGHGAGE